MTGHLRLYWIRTSCKRYKYERHFYGKIIKKRYYNKQASCSYIFYGKIISVHSFLEDINEIIHEADSRMYEEKRSMKHRKA